MSEMLAPYADAIPLIVLIVILVMAQSFVAAFFRNAVEKHEAGAALEANHGSATYRMVRSFENSLENVAMFFPAVALAVIAGVSPGWVYWVSLLFLLSRAAHWACYALNIPPARTLSFAVGFFATLALAIVTLMQTI